MHVIESSAQANKVFRKMEVDILWTQFVQVRNDLIHNANYLFRTLHCIRYWFQYRIRFHVRYRDSMTYSKLDEWECLSWFTVKLHQCKLEETSLHLSVIEQVRKRQIRWSIGFDDWNDWQTVCFHEDPSTPRGQSADIQATECQIWVLSKPSLHWVCRALK